MSKRILLIGYNFHPEPTGIGKYSGEMIQWLANKGYECTVITGYPYYPQWKVQEKYRKRQYWYQKESIKFEPTGSISVLRCPMYVPAKPTGLKRLLVDFSFAVSAFLRLLLMIPGKKYDCVVVVVPSFMFGILGVLYKKFSKSEFVYHIQDMQIEAARELGMIKSSKALDILFKMEQWILNNADVVSSISNGMVNKIKHKINKEVLLFPNWADVKYFQPVDNRELLKCNYGFESADKIIMYSGAIGEKQGLESVLEAAGRYKHIRELKFVICGSGPYKARLEDLVREMGLNNIFFFPTQPHDKFNEFLNMADVHLVVQKANASDLVMPSKLTTILAVGGLALVTANEDSDLNQLIRAHDMGIVVKAESQEALEAGILLAVSDDHIAKRQNARAYAERFISINKVMSTFEEAVLVKNQVAVTF